MIVVTNVHIESVFIDNRRHWANHGCKIPYRGSISCVESEKIVA